VPFDQMPRQRGADPASAELRFDEDQIDAHPVFISGKPARQSTSVRQCLRCYLLLWLRVQET
jgi:hypothetical protein